MGMAAPRSSLGRSAAAATLTEPDDIGPGVSAEAPVLIVGLGEVGRPLLEILSGTHQAAGRDLEDRAFHGVRILHLCFPFGPDFVSAAERYVSLYEPEVVVVNSTVVPGTTRAVQQVTGTPAVYSPVRGKHVRMTEELRRYRKFVAGTSAEAVASVTDHFTAAGMTTQRMSSFESLELLRRPRRMGAGDGSLLRVRGCRLLGNDRVLRRDRVLPTGQLRAGLHRRPLRDAQPRPPRAGTAVPRHRRDQAVERTARARMADLRPVYRGTTQPTATGSMT
jgi:hypothetical protein